MLYVEISKNRDNTVGWTFLRRHQKYEVGILVEDAGFEKDFKLNLWGKLFFIFFEYCEYLL